MGTLFGGGAGGIGGGLAGATAGAAVCSPSGPGAIACGAGGAAAGAAAGAKLGAFGGAFVGSALDVGIALANEMSGSGGGKPKIQSGETGNFNYAVRKLGLDRNAASDLLHQLKRAAGLRGSDNVWINTATGDVRAQATGELIGNLLP